MNARLRCGRGDDCSHQELPRQQMNQLWPLEQVEWSNSPGQLDRGGPIPGWQQLPYSRCHSQEWHEVAPLDELQVNHRQLLLTGVVRGGPCHTSVRRVKQNAA